MKAVTDIDLMSLYKSDTITIAMVEMTLDEARAFGDIELDDSVLIEAIDEAQAPVFSETSDDAYVIIRIVR